eukprot:491568-Alexandrium_andersonii.AAC.1
MFFHTDKYPGGHTREAFNAVSHASSVLSDPILRYYYDVLCGFLPDGPTDPTGPRYAMVTSERDVGFREIPE